MADVDLLVIGAGPAGLAAGTAARRASLSVLVLDEQPSPGGQIWRGVESVPAVRAAVLGPEYTKGAADLRAFRESGAGYLAGATVWNVGRDRAVNYTKDGASREVTAGHVLIATGALERPIPIPGWTLPGVMTAGALQILLKAAGTVPEGPVVVAGGGPLVWLLARQLVAAGAPPAAVVDTMPKGRPAALWRDLVRGLPASSYLAKGLSLKAAVRAAKVPVVSGAVDLLVEGTDRATALAFTAGGRRQRIEAGTVALHQGVIPNQQISRAIGATHDWDPVQAAFRPRRDEWLFLDVPGFSVAGDGGGVGGVAAARLEGRLAAIAVAHRLGRIETAALDDAARGLRKALRRHRAIRPFLDQLYAPPPALLAPADDVVVCRCEEVTAGAIRAAVRLGAPGPNQVKSYLRCGMGPCQGRLCGTTVTTLIAAERHVGEDEVGYYRIRPPLKPVSVAELAALAAPPAAMTPAG